MKASLEAVVPFVAGMEAGSSTAVALTGFDDDSC